MTLDLTQRGWLPGLSGGVARDVSLSDALGGAGDIAALTATPASMSPALLRYLLSVVLDVFGAPRSREEWAERWSVGHFDASLIVGYLDQHRHRFDLFSEAAPFAQAAGLRTPKGEVKPVSVLLPSIATGNSTPLFSARTEADSSVLTPAEAARWLIHALAWDTAGLKSGAAGDPQAPKGKAYGQLGPLGRIGVVMPVGRNLFETLMLNLPIVYDGLAPDDAPHWRRPPMGPTWEPRQPTGLLDLLTWPSRRVRLIPEEVDGRAVVRSVVLAAGDRMLTVPREEPHTLWNVTRNPKPDDPPERPRRHSSGKATWQGLDALLAVSDEATESDKKVRSSTLLRQVAKLEADDLIDPAYPLNVEVVGYEYGSHDAVFDNLVADSLPLPVVALRVDGELRGLLDQFVVEADELIRAVNRLDDDLRRAAGGDPTPSDSGQRPGTALVHRLDPVVRRVLRGLQASPDAVDGARHAWHHHAWRITRRLGDELLANIGPTAFTGRPVAGSKASGKQTVVRASSAEASFRWRVNKAVGRDGGGPPASATEEAS